MKHVVDIQSKSTQKTVTGNAYVYTTSYANVPAFVQEGASGLRLLDDGRKVSIDYKIYLQAPVVVNPADLVLWNGLTLKAIHVRDMMSLGLMYEVNAVLFIDGA